MPPPPPSLSPAATDPHALVVVRAVLKQEPTDQQMEALFKMIDTDNRCESGTRERARERENGSCW